MNFLKKLTGKRALVTAGAQGIGRAISEALLDAGCHVFIHYHNSDDGALKLKAYAASRGRDLVSASADLTQSGSGTAIVNSAVDALGGIDILINNAGSLVDRRSLGETDDAFWEKVQALNVGSMVRVTRAAVPHLRKSAADHGGASIVNLASLAGRKGGHAGSLAYASAKGTVLTFTRALAAELGPVGIRVNALAPGLILQTSFHETHSSEESINATVAALPLGRAGDPADVSRAAVYLASEYDGFVTGATLDINGGAWSG